MPTLSVFAGNEDKGPVGEIDIPADVLAAAKVVSDWLQGHPALVLHGLRFVDGDDD